MVPIEGLRLGILGVNDHGEDRNFAARRAKDGVGEQGCSQFLPGEAVIYRQAPQPRGGQRGIPGQAPGQLGGQFGQQNIRRRQRVETCDGIGGLVQCDIGGSDPPPDILCDLRMKVAGQSLAGTVKT